MKIIAFLAFLSLWSGFHDSGGLSEAVELYEKGKYGQAVSRLQQLSAASPSDPEMRLWLGRSYLKVRAWDKAVLEIEKSVQLKPANAKYRLWLGRACGLRASHSSVFTAFGWARRVLKEFETARKLAPADLDVRFDLVEYYLNAPGILGGGKQKAEAEAEAIARIDSVKGHTARAIIYSKQKDWELAKKELKLAVLENPGSHTANKDLADLLLERGDFDGALNCAKQALALDASSKRARLITAAANVRLKSDLEEAAASLRALASGTLTDADPSFEEVYYWLGECYLEQKDPTNAGEAFRTALAFNPDFDRAKTGLSRSKQTAKD
jgi:tetratricopeptide (TPR) repeat protein